MKPENAETIARIAITATSEPAMTGSDGSTGNTL